MRSRRIDGTADWVSRAGVRAKLRSTRPVSTRQTRIFTGRDQTGADSDGDVRWGVGLGIAVTCRAGTAAWTAASGLGGMHAPGSSCASTMIGSGGPTACPWSSVARANSSADNEPTCRPSSRSWSVCAIVSGSLSSAEQQRSDVSGQSSTRPGTSATESATAARCSVFHRCRWQVTVRAPTWRRPWVCGSRSAVGRASPRRCCCIRCSIPRGTRSRIATTRKATSSRPNADRAASGSRRGGHRRVRHTAGSDREQPRLLITRRPGRW